MKECLIDIEPNSIIYAISQVGQKSLFGKLNQEGNLFISNVNYLNPIVYLLHFIGMSTEAIQDSFCCFTYTVTVVIFKNDSSQSETLEKEEFWPFCDLTNQAVKSLPYKHTLCYQEAAMTKFGSLTQGEAIKMDEYGTVLTRLTTYNSHVHMAPKNAIFQKGKSLTLSNVCNCEKEFAKYLDNLAKSRNTSTRFEYLLCCNIETLFSAKKMEDLVEKVINATKESIKNNPFYAIPKTDIIKEMKELFSLTFDLSKTIIANCTKSKKVSLEALLERNEEEMKKKKEKELQNSHKKIMTSLAITKLLMSFTRFALKGHNLDTSSFFIKRNELKFGRESKTTIISRKEILNFIAFLNKQCPIANLPCFNNNNSIVPLSQIHSLNPSNELEFEIERIQQEEQLLHPHFINCVVGTILKWQSENPIQAKETFKSTQLSDANVAYFRENFQKFILGSSEYNTRRSRFIYFYIKYKFFSHFNRGFSLSLLATIGAIKEIGKRGNGIKARSFNNARTNGIYIK